MPLTIEWVLIDCVDLEVMTTFWCEALDLDPVSTGPSGGRLLAARDGSGRRLGLLPGHGEKTAKNRRHLDLRPDGDQQAEVRRLEALGAQLIDIGQGDTTWVVMVDPEGNEFCVLRGSPRRKEPADPMVMRLPMAPVPVTTPAAMRARRWVSLGGTP